MQIEIDTSDLLSEIQYELDVIIDANVESKLDDIDSPEKLLRDYIKISNPCGIGLLFEQAVDKAVDKKLRQQVELEVREVFRRIMFTDDQQPEGD